MQFAMLPLLGIAQGAQPILSYNFGAENAPRVKKTFKLLVVVCLVYSFLLWCAVMLFPRAFAAMFTSEPNLVDFTARVLRIYFGGMLIFGIQTACQMTFVSLGSAPSSVLVAIVRKFVLLLPLIYIMPHLFSDPVIGIFVAEPVADVLAVSFTAVLFFFSFRKAMKKIAK
jgi:Na+-driven multidrug efflux pump